MTEAKIESNPVLESIEKLKTNDKVNEYIALRTFLRLMTDTESLDKAVKELAQVRSAGKPIGIYEAMELGMLDEHGNKNKKSSVLQWVNDKKETSVHINERVHGAFAELGYYPHHVDQESKGTPGELKPVNTNIRECLVLDAVVRTVGADLQLISLPYTKALQDAADQGLLEDGAVIAVGYDKQVVRGLGRSLIKPIVDEIFLNGGSTLLDVSKDEKEQIKITAIPPIIEKLKDRLVELEQQSSVVGLLREESQKTQAHILSARAEIDRLAYQSTDGLYFLELTTHKEGRKFVANDSPQGIADALVNRLRYFEKSLEVLVACLPEGERAQYKEALTPMILPVSNLWARRLHEFSRRNTPGKVAVAGVVAFGVIVGAAAAIPQIPGIDTGLDSATLAADTAIVIGGPIALYLLTQALVALWDKLQKPAPQQPAVVSQDAKIDVDASTAAGVLQDAKISTNRSKDYELIAAENAAAAEAVKRQKIAATRNRGLGIAAVLGVGSFGSAIAAGTGFKDPKDWDKVLSIEVPGTDLTIAALTLAALAGMIMLVLVPTVAQAIKDFRASSPPAEDKDIHNIAASMNSEKTGENLKSNIGPITSPDISSRMTTTTPLLEGQAKSDELQPTTPRARYGTVG